MGLLARILEFLQSFFGGNREQPETPTPPTELTPEPEPSKPVTKNYYPELLRVTNVNPELTGDIVGTDINNRIVDMPRKSLLYAAIRCEVSCGYTIKVCAVHIDENGDEREYSVAVSGDISINNSQNRVLTVPLPYPNQPNGYKVGTNTVYVTLYDKNRRNCGEKKFVANVSV